ncbi:mannitol dehydrogenase family protein [Geodermatophilus aquaeductus]|uniref:Mannitol-1-phosphate 5-dehydrogenase n=1 Tax=Geodermatophilus aquaeductus TaxID=1564161 RepID=A0A521C5U6_9ACTN|nr:mannitol dehydrogenase family protein [Geodermatophilus aquaeductus]SMO54735.1 fructuronate reductase/mannitol 2-dehydrogenase [Geodermatophilus aquaeductus]
MAQPERSPWDLPRAGTAPTADPVAHVRPLTSATLEQHGARLTVPTYDRAALTPAVVHLSVGGFSRAHQLIYFDEVAQRRISTEWGVVGVGLRHRTLQEALAPQDNLYTVVERSPDGERARVVGVLTDYLFAPDAPGAVLDRLADPRTRVVTMTITDAGYLLDPTTRTFTPDDDVRHDLASPAAPRTVFGFLVEALDRRRRAGTAPFTVVSCDNLHRNGDATRAAVVGFAALRDEVLARWITDRVAFPSSMVDRITPQTTPEERAAVAQRHRVDDRWPVITEPFSQWVVEDTFCNGRPPLDEVGVRFVRNVTDHELMKTRLLNASHSALGYLGTLAGHERIDVLMGDPLFADYVTRLMDDEVTPLIPVPEGIDLDAYKATLLQRFANPAIADRLSRLCRRGSTKLPHHLLPSLRQALAEGRPHALLTLALAGWIAYLQRVDDDGRPVPVEDDRGPHLQALALAGGTDPRPLLAEEPVFGDLGAVPGFADELAGVLRRLQRDGVRATVAAAVLAGAR